MAGARHRPGFVTRSGPSSTGVKRAPGEIYLSPMNSPEPAPPAPPRLAAIDVGTNTIRLTVAEVQEDDTYRVLDEEREMVRLGERLDRTGRLSEEAIQRDWRRSGR